MATSTGSPSVTRTEYVHSSATGRVPTASLTARSRNVTATCPRLPGGGGDGCFLAGTLITLVDGSVKPIESVLKSDQLRAFDPISGGIAASDILTIHPPRTVSSYLVINDETRVTATQPMLSRGKWVEAGELRLGDVLTAGDGTAVTIYDLRVVHESATVYNLAVASGTYVADGVVVHNKTLPYTIAPCPTCGPGGP